MGDDGWGKRPVFTNRQRSSRALTTWGSITCSVKPGSMCRLADTGGENSFQSYKSCCTVERASYGCKSRGWAFSLTSATMLHYNHPPVNEATISFHLWLSWLSFSFTFHLSVQSNFTRPTQVLSEELCRHYLWLGITIVIIKVGAGWVE